MSEEKAIGHGVYPPTIKRSIWGAVQYQHKYAEGIDFVSTPGHGGFKLDRKRNTMIPKPLRMEGGWYEEDVNFNIVIYFFSDKVEGWEGKKPAAEKQIKNWLWTEWEKYSGETLKPGESSCKDQDMWTEAHKDKFVVVSACYADDKHWVNVTAERKSDCVRGEWCIPSAEYSGREKFGFVIDEERHLPRI